MYLTRYSRDIPSLFNDFFNWTPSTLSHSLDSAKMDVIEHDDNIEVVAEIPGFKKEDIKVEYEKGYLTISGEVTKEKEEDVKYLHREIGKRSFARKLSLGDTFNVESINATFKDGILSVTLSKSEKEKVRAIEIN